MCIQGEVNDVLIVNHLHPSLQSHCHKLRSGRKGIPADCLQNKFKFTPTAGRKQSDSNRVVSNPQAALFRYAMSWRSRRIHVPPVKRRAKLREKNKGEKKIQSSKLSSRQLYLLEWTGCGLKPT